MILLIVVALICGIAALALLGGAVGSFEGKKPAAGWSYLAGVFVIALAFSHFGVFMGYWDLPSFVPFASATLGKPDAPSWLQRSGSGSGTYTVSTSPEQLKTDLEGKVKELEGKRVFLAGLLDKLNKEKVETIEALKALKIDSVAGLKDNPLAQQKAKRLQELVQRIQATESKTGEYEVALDKARTVLKDLEYQLALKEAGLDEKEFLKVTETIALVDDQLKSSADGGLLNPLQVDTILKKELDLKD